MSNVKQMEYREKKQLLKENLKETYKEIEDIDEFYRTKTINETVDLALTMYQTYLDERTEEILNGLKDVENMD